MKSTKVCIKRVFQFVWSDWQNYYQCKQSFIWLYCRSQYYYVPKSAIEARYIVNMSAINSRFRKK